MNVRVGHDEATGWWQVAYQSDAESLEHGGFIVLARTEEAAHFVARHLLTREGSPSVDELYGEARLLVAVAEGLT